MVFDRGRHDKEQTDVRRRQWREYRRAVKRAMFRGLDALPRKRGTEGWETW